MTETVSLKPENMTLSTAVFSPSRRYRYELRREWNTENRRELVVIGLNPSTADEHTNDPTIRRCLGFAHRWGCGRLLMLNLFGYRATDPKDLKRALEPVGMENGNAFGRLLATRPPNADNRIILAAWGTHGGFQNRDKHVMRWLSPLLVHCLGVTKHGFPKHPLYLPYSAQRIIYPGREAEKSK